MVLLLVAGAALVWLGSRSVAKTPGSARRLFWLALLARLLYVGFQVYEFKHLGFDPQLGGGYVSVFVGLKGVLLAEVVVAMIWLGTLIAPGKADRRRDRETGLGRRVRQLHGDARRRRRGYRLSSPVFPLRCPSA